MLSFPFKTKVVLWFPLIYSYYYNYKPSLKISKPSKDLFLLIYLIYLLISFYSYIMNIVNHWNSLYWFQILLLIFSHREAGSIWSLFRFNFSIFQIELQYIDFALSWFPLPPMSILTMLPSRYDLGPSIHHHILTPLFNNSIIYIFIFIFKMC